MGRKACCLRSRNSSIKLRKKIRINAVDTKAIEALCIRLQCQPSDIKVLLDCLELLKWNVRKVNIINSKKKHIII